MTDPQTPIQPYYQEEEVTLKEIILKVRAFLYEIFVNWKLILIICIPFVSYMLYDAIISPIRYPATLTFMVEEDESTRLGGVANVLGQFGISGVQRGKYNLDRILEISRSRRVLQMALFAKCEVEGDKDFLANHLIKEYDYHARWKEDSTGLKGFLFTHDSIAGFNRVENRVLKALQHLMNGTNDDPGAYQTSYNDDTGIMTLKMSAPSEELAITMVDTLFGKLTSYYVFNATDKAETTYQVMKLKTDSLAKALSAAEYRLAEFLDKNKNIFSAREGSLQQTRLTTEVQRLQILHGESLKNLEYADFTLKNRTPFITLIDNPLPPLRPVEESKPKAILIGLLLGLIVGSAFVIGRKIYRDAMQ